MGSTEQYFELILVLAVAKVLSAAIDPFLMSAERKVSQLLLDAWGFATIAS